MTSVSEAKDRLSSGVRGITQIVRQKIFGVNNEHIDFVMDSFYKLDPTQRNAAIGVLVGLISTFVVGAFSLYFLQVAALENDLNEVFLALNRVKALKADAAVANGRFDKLVGVVAHKTKGLVFKPYFEKISRDLNMEIKEIREKPVDPDPNNLLAAKIEEVHVDVRITKISIPKLLDFLVRVEKDGNLVRIQNLKITGLYGDKLFFDVETIFRGYQVNS